MPIENPDHADNREESIGSLWQIEPMREADLEMVAALEQQCGLNPWGTANYRRDLKNPLIILLVALSEAQSGERTDPHAAHISVERSTNLGSLAGFLAGWVVADEFQINNLAVDHAHRRQGIGAALLKAGLRAARERGAARAVLEVRAANLPALALYHRHGFVCVGKRKAYYHDPPDDGWIMACEGEAWKESQW